MHKPHFPRKREKEKAFFFLPHMPSVALRRLVGCWCMHNEIFLLFFPPNSYGDFFGWEGRKMSGTTYTVQQLQTHQQKACMHGKMQHRGALKTGSKKQLTNTPPSSSPVPDVSDVWGFRVGGRVEKKTLLFFPREKYIGPDHANRERRTGDLGLTSTHLEWENFKRRKAQIFPH